MDVIHTKATLNAKAIMVGWAITTFNADNLFIFNVIGNLTTHAAEWANGVNLAINYL